MKKERNVCLGSKDVELCISFRICTVVLQLQICFSNFFNKLVFFKQFSDFYIEKRVKTEGWVG